MLGNVSGRLAVLNSKLNEARHCVAIRHRQCAGGRQFLNQCRPLIACRSLIISISEEGRPIWF